MFGFVGKLFLCSIFSACQIYELGPQKKLRQSTNIVPNGTTLAGAVQKELKEGQFSRKNSREFTSKYLLKSEIALKTLKPKTFLELMTKG